MDFIVLSLGSNIGERSENLSKAREEIAKNDIKVSKFSGVYDTEPSGFADQDYFLNQVLLVETDMGPEDLLKSCLAIENKLGRKRGIKNGPRVIDIDLLFYKDELISTESLMIPHPRIQERKFVLQPLNELIPDQEHPIFGSTITELLDECEDELIVSSSGADF